MKKIKVSAALILRTSSSGVKEVFATARGYGEWKGWWEFPGGKIEEGESAEEACVREIKEELDTLVIPLENLGLVEYDYPNFHLSMNCIVCQIKEGSLKLLEAQDACWLSKENLESVKWLPADTLIFSRLKEFL